MASAVTRTTTTTDSAARSRRRIQKFLLVWADANVRSSASDTQNTVKYLRTIINDVKLIDHSDECYRILERMSHKQTFVITSGELGKELVPRIHDLPGLNGIYIFCGNKQYHEQWSRKWKRVRAVETNIEVIGETLRKFVKQSNQDDIAMSIIDVGDGSEADLNRLESSFFYSSLLKNAILNMAHNLKEEMTIFKDSFLKKSEEKDIDEEILSKFQKDYRSDQAIFWYTTETFLYPLMNGALQNLEVDIIVDMGFFIHDLHHQIETLYNQQLSIFGFKSFIVYRGQGLPKEKFTQLKKNKGGLLGFNSFLLTSRNKTASIDFAERGAETSGNVGLLFVMTIDPTLKLTPFARVKQHMAIHGEVEILFSMHTVFRIGECKQLSETPELHEVQLILTSEEDPSMNKLRNYIYSSKEATGWHRIGRILLEMNQLDKAEEIYQRLLENETDELDGGFWNFQLGITKSRQPDYPKALSNYERALAIFKKTLPDTHLLLASCYNNIGLVYSDMGDYSNALSNHERALAIFKKTLPEAHPYFTTSYGNIGLVYSDMGDYPNAVSNYERALAIQKKILPERHPDLATSHDNIGLVYYRMKNYPKALEYLEKALGIWINALPANHPNIATCRQSIADTKKEMNR